MTCDGQFKGASGKKIQKLSEDRASPDSSPDDQRLTRQPGPKSMMSNEIVYPNEDANRPERLDCPDPNRLAMPDRSDVESIPELREFMWPASQ